MRAQPLLATVLLACLPTCAGPPQELDLWADAAAGVESEALARLCEQVWENDLRWDPFRATRLGDPRLHGEVPRRDLRARDQRIADLRAFHARAQSIAPSGLSAEDRLTRELLVGELADRIAVLQLGLDEWVVDPIQGPHV